MTTDAEQVPLVANVPHGPEKERCLVRDHDGRRHESRANRARVLCSIPLDWYARRFVETHVNYHVFNPFPIPRSGPDDPTRRRVEEIVGRLAAVDDRYADWAAAVGVPLGGVSDSSERDDLVAVLDAAVDLDHDRQP